MLEEYKAAIEPLRAFIETTYRPLLRAYLKAIPDGRSEELADLAADLDAAADRLESLWSATFFARLADFDASFLIHEAAGAMAMLSSIWGGLGSRPSR